ncbi:deoxyribodipyrimidine photo-lyase [Candidatus Dependentiae bacterium]|nr:deoxyribodipyrimidine photo-lyase [Candidatus Dependentiae bacterium]
MQPPYNTTLFIFRRDLRLEDNTALTKALKNSKEVIPCFIINPDQVGKSNNYRSMHGIQFMVQSLLDLNAWLNRHGTQLYLFHGQPDVVVSTLLESLSIDAVYVNKDYTPYSKHRDETLARMCKEQGVSFYTEKDVLLHEPEEAVSAQGKPYQIFTPFFRKNSLLVVEKPVFESHTNYPARYTTKTIQGTLSISSLESLLVPHKTVNAVQGGRTSSLGLLHSIKKFKDYATSRDFPEKDTTLLSASLKFGTLSVREVYYSIVEQLGPQHPLIRQLFWRDFFYHVAYFNPFVFGHAFQGKYDGLEWNTDRAAFTRWCEGTTGFPIIDAGMRQLKEVGYMHNRARLLTGSFLVKDLHCNWQWGERYFAQNLTDYDPCINNGNWQWVASTGCDHQPYFRIFNPWLQQKKFDPECIYIKRWVPELRNVAPHVIHTWFKQAHTIPGYPSPMVVHEREVVLTKNRYKNVSPNESNY